MGSMRYGVERALICVCLILHAKCMLLKTAEGNHHVQGDEAKIVERKHLVARKHEKKVKSIKQKKHQIPPWLDTVYGKLEYSSYVTDAFAKKSDITPPDVIASKRTIKIGSQVCGSIKDANDYERKWRRKRKNETLASIRAVHKCCWRHNRCPKIVPAKTTKFGFKNDVEYDIMACKCDSLFKKCLKEGKSYTADAIGHLYFDTLRVPCLTFSSYPENRHEADYVSVVPDVQIDHPKIGAAKVSVQLDGKRSGTLARNDTARISEYSMPYKKSKTSELFEKEAILLQQRELMDAQMRGVLLGKPLVHPHLRKAFFGRPRLNMSML